MSVTDWIQVLLMLVLVGVTAFYSWRTADIAKATKQQAEASVKMAEEMREQRRPIVVQKVVPPEYEGISIGPEEQNAPISSDCFKIYNVGNNPAIELEIILLDEKKKLLGQERNTFLQPGNENVMFKPYGLQNHVNSTCFLLCRYRGVFSKSIKQTWYQTLLPFVPVKSQSGDRIIIKPGEIEFNVVSKKDTF